MEPIDGCGFAANEVLVTGEKLVGVAAFGKGVTEGFHVDVPPLNTNNDKCYWHKINKILALYRYTFELLFQMKVPHEQ